MIERRFPLLRTAMNYLRESLTCDGEYKFRTELMKDIYIYVTGMGIIVKISRLQSCRMTARSESMMFAIIMSIIF
jgi:hypothetical protein